MKIILAIILCCFLLSFPSVGSKAQSIPEFHERVTDLSGSLSGSELRTLESKLATFERESSNQIAILMISSLDGSSIEEYSLAVAEKNQFGKKGRDNGVLLVVAKDEHKLRFEVGYGLEGVLPDAVCDQIIRHVIVPRFRAHDFYGGIDAGIDAVILATKGEFKGSSNDNAGKGFTALAIILFIIFFGLLPKILFGRRRYYINSGGWRSTGMWYGGFGGGGFGGGGFGGGFGGGGGFSGGGGSFGGGGASGSW